MLSGLAIMAIRNSLENPEFPKIVQFETSTTCNANCLMCPHDKMKRRGTARWSLISKIIREVTEQDIEVICPFLMQEPLLEPRLVPVLANIKQRMPKVTTAVYTNMSVLSDETIHHIVDSALIDELHISFYGPTEELYAKWQPPLKREVTVENIKRLYEYRQKKQRSKPVMTLHVLSVPELILAAHGYNDMRMYVDRVGNVQFDTFHGDIPDLAGDQSLFMGKPAMERTPCQRLWSGINVHFDGSVVPCCIDYDGENVLGNATKDRLTKIWVNKDFQRFRKLHMQGRWNEIDMCRECVVHEYQFSKEWIEYWRSREVTVKS